MRLALEHKTKNLGDKKFCFPLLHEVTQDTLTTALKNGKCSDLYPLFFAKEGNEHIMIPLVELTAEKVWNHIMR